MNLFSLLIPVLFIAVYVFMKIKKHIHKIKNYSYHLGSSFQNEGTLIYYIAYQSKHGVYKQALNLKPKYTYFLSKDLLGLLCAQYTNEEDAQNALEKFLIELKKIN